jgi:hypothetical protein
VITQRAKPITDKIPQVKSNLVNFHSAFLFTNEPMNIVNGNKPKLNVIIDSIPAPLSLIAANAIKGAIDHKRNETRLGFYLSKFLQLQS